MRSLAFLAVSWCILASGEARAQTPAARYQALLTSGNQALALKNYPTAISYYQQAVRLFPTNQQGVTLLQQATQAYHAAQTAYTTNLTAGRVALGKSNFQLATTDFANAAAALPSDASAVATATRFANGTAAIQKALAFISNGDFTDATTSYNTASQLVGTDPYAKVPLNQIRTAIAENRNPAQYFAQNFNQGVTALVNGQYPQAQGFFKTAANLPAGMADQLKAQNCYNAAVALQTASTDLSSKPPNYVDAVTQYQTVLTNFAGLNNLQGVSNRLLSTLGTALNTEVAKGNQYLNLKDMDNAYITANNVTALATLFPKSTTAKAFLARFQTQSSVTLATALSNGSINPANFSATGASASSITLTFTSATVNIWYLQIPAGTVFTAQNLGFDNTQTQNMVVLANTSFQIKPGVNNQLAVAAVSTNPANQIPTAANQLVLTNNAASKALLSVLNAVQTAQPGSRVAQFAVWIVLNPALTTANIAVGSVGPTLQEIATLQTIFRSAGLNPQAYVALQ